MSEPIKFYTGQAVEKWTGDAQYNGVIVGCYLTLKGHLRYVVEVLPQHFQMICNEKQLRPYDNTE